MAQVGVLDFMAMPILGYTDDYTRKTVNVYFEVQQYAFQM